LSDTFACAGATPSGARAQAPRSDGQYGGMDSAPSRTVTVSRLVHAPRASVYKALLDPEAVSIWRTPHDMTCVVHEFDAREGGAFRVSLTYATARRLGKTSGATDTYGGRFQQLIPDTMVREVVEFASDDPALRGALVATTTLADAQGGTDVVLTHEGVPAAVRLEDDELGCTMALEQLARLVEGTVDHPAHEVPCFLVTTVHGPAWDRTVPIRQQAGWDAHAAFMDLLVADGFLLIGGPLEDGVHTALVVVAKSEFDVRRRFAKDPWALAGMLTLESVRPWRIWLGVGRLR
jgi:uncharacterized protein YndB with AHSA1/START domain/uncharacterized protein YciI